MCYHSANRDPAFDDGDYDDYDDYDGDDDYNDRLRLAVSTAHPRVVSPVALAHFLPYLTCCALNFCLVMVLRLILHSLFLWFYLPSCCPWTEGPSILHEL